MRSNTQKKTPPSLISAARKKSLISQHVNPLSDAKLMELKELLTMASKTKTVEQDPALNKALQRTLGSIESYNRMMDDADRKRLGKQIAEVKAALQKDIYKNIKAYNKKTDK
jgi:hypothetical protein